MVLLGDKLQRWFHLQEISRDSAPNATDSIRLTVFPALRQARYLRAVLRALSAVCFDLPPQGIAQFWHEGLGNNFLPIYIYQAHHIKHFFFPVKLNMFQLYGFEYQLGVPFNSKLYTLHHVSDMNTYQILILKSKQHLTANKKDTGQYTKLRTSKRTHTHTPHHTGYLVPIKDPHSKKKNIAQWFLHTTWMLIKPSFQSQQKHPPLQQGHPHAGPAMHML